MTSPPRALCTLFWALPHMRPGRKWQDLPAAFSLQSGLGQPSHRIMLSGSQPSWDRVLGLQSCESWPPHFKTSCLPAGRT